MSLGGLGGKDGPEAGIAFSGGDYEGEVIGMLTPAVARIGQDAGGPFLLPPRSLSLS